jgi:O-antigen/teichoic acid export membrane protein
MFILIGRSLGAPAAGVFQLAATYLLVFSVLTRGLDELVIRQVARFPRDVKRYFVTFLVLRFFLALLLYGILVLIVTLVIDYPASTLWPILILSISLVPDSLISAANAILLGQRRFGIPTLVAVGTSMFRVVFGMALLYFDSPVVQIALLWTLSSIIAAIVSISLVGLQTQRRPGRFVFDRSLVSHEFPSMLPFIIIGFLMAIEYQVDVILLSVLRTEEDIGWYGAATTIVFTLTMIPQAYRMSVYPLMARYATEDLHKLKQLYEKSLRYLGTLALPMVAGIVLMAPGIIGLIYGDEFLPAIVVLQTLVIILIPTFLNVPNVRMMFVLNRQSWVTWMLLGSMLINVGLNVWLTPTLGAQGAALARACSSMAFFVANYLVLRLVVAKFETSLLRLLWRPAVAAVLMSLVLLATRAVPVLIAVVIGAAAYFCVLLLIGGIPAEDLQTIRQSIRKRQQSASMAIFRR